MAQSGINKCIILGRLGQDPEVKYLPSGGAVANITVATSESWKDKNTGEDKQKTEWHRVSIFGKLAEIAGEYLRKGTQVYIEGQLQTRKWQDQQGQDRFTTEVVVQGYNGIMQMLGSSNGGQQNQQQPQQAPQQQGHQNQVHQPQQQAPQGQPQRQQQMQNQQQGYQQQNSQHPQQAQYSEPPVSYDPDIPFAPIGLQHPSLVLSM